MYVSPDIGVLFTLYTLSHRQVRVFEGPGECRSALSTAVLTFLDILVTLADLEYLVIDSVPFTLVFLRSGKCL